MMGLRRSIVQVRLRCAVSIVAHTASAAKPSSTAASSARARRSPPENRLAQARDHVGHGQPGVDDLEEARHRLHGERAARRGELQHEQHDGGELAGRAQGDRRINCRMAVKAKAATSTKPSSASGSTGCSPRVKRSTATSTIACTAVRAAPGHRPARATWVSGRVVRPGARAARAAAR